MEFTLELYDRQRDGITSETVIKLLESYKEGAAHKEKVKVLSVSEVEKLMEAIRDFNIEKKFIEAAYKEAEDYRSKQGEKIKSRPKKSSK